MTKTPETLTVTESHQILESMICKSGNQKKARIGIRNYLFTLFMLDAGLRVGEVSRLLVSDVVMNGEPVKSIVVRKEIAKGGRERIIPLSSRLQAAITEYQDRLLKYIPHQDWHFLFYTYKLEGHITARQIQRIIESASQRIIGRKIHPHILRHTFASKLMRQVNARIVQELLGHKNLSTTQIYMHPNGDDLAKAIEGLNQ